MAGAALCALGLVTLAAPFLIPVDSYRPLLVWAIDAGTGRHVQIDHLQLYVVPSLRLRLRIVGSPIEVTQVKGQLALYASRVQVTACTFSASASRVSAATATNCGCSRRG